MVYLKQSTAVTLLIGPFVDSTDGNTVESGLTISQADVRLSKNGGNMAQKGDATACTHDELGYYTCPLSTTDTGTLGILKVMVHESGALPVWQECMVVTANVYDTLCSTDQLDVNVTNVAGTAQTGNDNGADINAILVDTGTTLQGELDAIQAAVITNAAGVDIAADIIAVKAETATIVADTNELQTDDVPGLISALNDPTAATIADAVWDEAATGHTDAGKAGEQLWTDLDAVLADTNELQTDDIPGTLTTIEGKVDTVDGNVDSILTDTGTTLQAELDAIQAAVITNAAGADIAADIIAVKAETAAIVNDTDLIDDGTSGLAKIATDVAAVLVDTGTTLDGNITAIKAKTDLLPEGIAKNTALSNFEFLMVDATDHATPETGLTVAGNRSIDGGAFASVTGAIAEVGNGIYQFDAAQADTNGDLITWRFSSAGAADTFVTFQTVS